MRRPTVLIAAAGALAWGAASCAAEGDADRTGPPASETPRLSVRDVGWSHPREPCEARRLHLSLRTTTYEPAEAEVGGKTVPFDRANADFTFEARELPASGVLVATVRSDAGQSTMEVAVPPLTGAPAVGGLRDPKDHAGATDLGMKLEVGSEYDGVGFIDTAGNAVALVETCFTDSLEVEGAKVEKNEDGLFVVTLEGFVGELDWEGILRKELPMKLSGGETENEAELVVFFSLWDVATSVPGSAASPAKWPKAHDPTGKDGSTAILMRGPETRPLDALREGETLMDVALVAVVEVEYEDVGTCGPYSSAVGMSSYADKRRSDATVTLMDARTGESLGKKSFKGPRPKCPEGVLSRDGKAEPANGAIATKKILAWARKLARKPRQ